MSKWGKLAALAGIAAAPFTGGTSLAWVPAALGGAATVDGMIDAHKAGKAGAGGTPGMPGAPGSPPTILGTAQQLGEEGTGMLHSGQEFTKRSRDMFTPIIQRNQRLMGGDISSAYSELTPEIDAIGQQFQNVRNMVSTQPRGGGKTSAMAQIPIEQIRAISNLVSQERSKAADTQTNVASRLLTSGETERGQGLQGIESSGNMLVSKGNQDIAKRGQNIDMGVKIAESLAELAFLLKGSGGGGSGGDKKSGSGGIPYPSQGGGNGGVYGPWPSETPIPDSGGYGH